MNPNQAITRVARATGLAAPAGAPSEERALARSPVVPAACGGAILGALLTGLLLHPASAAAPPPLPEPPAARRAAPEARSVAAPVMPAPSRPAPRTPADDILDQALGDEEEDESAGALPLASALEQDPTLLDAALKRLRESEDVDHLSILAAALGNVRDPQVESVALELCGHAPSADRRAAAFELLDALDLPSALPAVLEALERERDPLVRRAALFALPTVDGASGADAARVVEVLSEILRADPDAESRRRAALGLGEWSRTPGAVAALASALRSDRSIDVRAGVAFALERARPGDLATRSALLATFEDPREDPAVRENAWQALGASAPLDPREHAAWCAFRDERAAVTDGSEAFEPEPEDEH